MKSSKMSLEH